MTEGPIFMRGYLQAFADLEAYARQREESVRLRVGDDETFTRWREDLVAARGAMRLLVDAKGG